MSIKDKPYKVRANELSIIADCLNIEGGDPYRRLCADHKNLGKFLWVNLIVVLDRPLVDGVIFDEIWNDNRFPLLENRIDELNEHQYMAAFLMIIQYYIEHAYELTDKDESEKIKITIHLHQDPSRKILCDDINKHLLMLMQVPLNIEIEYLTDTAQYFQQTKTDYSDTDILISLSQCAGLAEEYGPGTLYVCNKFIPFLDNGKIVKMPDRYRVENDLVKRLIKIVNSQFNIVSVD